MRRQSDDTLGTPRRRFRLFTVCLATIFTFGAAEIATRILLRTRLSPEEIYARTHHTSARGRFAPHAFIPYVLNPGYQDTNSLGFRGPEFAIEREPGVARVVCLGASTTYGLYVGTDQAYPARLEKLLTFEGIPCQVINAGVPGYISIDLLLTLQFRVLPLEPDVVIVYEGRNELFPQSFNNFLPDYSHFRKADYSIRSTNYLNKYLFGLSHLYFVLATYHGDRFGFDSREENPAYGQIRYENQPTSEELIANLNDCRRSETYRNTLRSIAAICKVHSIKLVLGTMAFQVERLATGVLVDDPAIHPALEHQLEQNNQIVREIAREQGATLVETEVLVKEPWLFHDDCHLNKEGHARRAELLLPAIAELATKSWSAHDGVPIGNGRKRFEAP